jgi:hypothetical protein
MRVHEPLELVALSVAQIEAVDRAERSHGATRSASATGSAEAPARSTLRAAAAPECALSVARILSMHARGECRGQNRNRHEGGEAEADVAACRSGHGVLLV